MTALFIGRLWDLHADGALDVGEGSRPWGFLPDEKANGYLDRLRVLYRSERVLFDELLTRPVLVLCSDDHNAPILAGILAKMGAETRGALEPHKTSKCAVRWCFNEGAREGCNFCFACWKSLPAPLRRQLAAARASCPTAPFDGATSDLYNATVGDALALVESRLP